jgi:hypothetical protein
MTATNIPEARVMSFDVVLVKAEIGAHVAKPDDFVRVRVEAESAYSAHFHDEVQKLVGGTPKHHVLHVVNPDQVTHAEMQAQHRAMNYTGDK